MRPAVSSTPLWVVAAASLVMATAAAGVEHPAGGANPAARAAAIPESQVAESFTAFCASWMTKLVAREVDNVAKIQWRENGAGVEGEYVGYSQEHSCDLKAPGGASVPIGKVNYKEMRYRKRGAAANVAAASAPEIMEVTEVTEIFRYDKGRWVY